MSEKETKTDSLDGKEPLPTIEQSPVKEKSLDEKINDVLGPFLKSEQVTSAVAIARDPKTGDVAIMYCGHFYDAAKILSEVLGKFREKIDSDLS